MVAQPTNVKIRSGTWNIAKGHRFVSRTVSSVVEQLTGNTTPGKASLSHATTMRRPPPPPPPPPRM